MYNFLNYRSWLCFYFDINWVFFLQEGELQLDSSGGGGIYSFTWRTKEACAVKPKDESGCNDKDTRISMLQKKDKKVTWN